MRFAYTAWQRDDKYLRIRLAITALLIRNRLAVRIAGSHPADRGSIPRYGSNILGPRPNVADWEIPVPKIFFPVWLPATMNPYCIPFCVARCLFLLYTIS